MLLSPPLAVVRYIQLSHKEGTLLDLGIGLEPTCVNTCIKQRVTGTNFLMGKTSQGSTLSYCVLWLEPPEREILEEENKFIL